MWTHLYSWYSADVTVCRKLVKDPQSKQNHAYSEIGEDNPYQQSSNMPPIGGMVPTKMVQAPSQRSNLTYHSYSVFLDLYKSMEEANTLDLQLTLGRL